MNYGDVSEKFKTYEKKQVVKAMLNNEEDIECNTAWGKQICHVGDYLVYSNNEYYPIKKEIFEKTYKEVL